MSKQHIPNSVRYAVYRRDEFKCSCCGNEHDLSIDHIHPESQGGTIDLNNLTTSCKFCNSRKHVQPVEVFLAKNPKQPEFMTFDETERHIELLDRREEDLRRQKERLLAYATRRWGKTPSIEEGGLA